MTQFGSIQPAAGRGRSERGPGGSGFSGANQTVQIRPTAVRPVTSREANQTARLINSLQRVAGAAVSVGREIQRQEAFTAQEERLAAQVDKGRAVKDSEADITGVQKQILDGDMSLVRSLPLDGAEPLDHFRSLAADRVPEDASESYREAYVERFSKQATNLYLNYAKEQRQQVRSEMLDELAGAAFGATTAEELTEARESALDPKAGLNITAYEFETKAIVPALQDAATTGDRDRFDLLASHLDSKRHAQLLAEQGRRLSAAESNFARQDRSAFEDQAKSYINDFNSGLIEDADELLDRLAELRPHLTEDAEFTVMSRAQSVINTRDGRIREARRAQDIDTITDWVSREIDIAAATSGDVSDYRIALRANGVPAGQADQIIRDKIQSIADSLFADGDIALGALRAYDVSRHLRGFTVQRFADAAKSMRLSQEGDHNADAINTFLFYNALDNGSSDADGRMKFARAHGISQKDEDIFRLAIAIGNNRPIDAENAGLLLTHAMQVDNSGRAAAAAKISAADISSNDISNLDTFVEKRVVNEVEMAATVAKYARGIQIRTQLNKDEAIKQALKEVKRDYVIVNGFAVRTAETNMTKKDLLDARDVLIEGMDGVIDPSTGEQVRAKDIAFANTGDGGGFLLINRMNQPLVSESFTAKKIERLINAKRREQEVLNGKEMQKRLDARAKKQAERDASDAYSAREEARGQAIAGREMGFDHIITSETMKNSGFITVTAMVTMLGKDLSGELFERDPDTGRSIATDTAITIGRNIPQAVSIVDHAINSMKRRHPVLGVLLDGDDE